MLTELESKLLAALKEAAPDRAPVDSYRMECQMCFSYMSSYSPQGIEGHASDCGWVAGRKMIAEAEAAMLGFAGMPSVDTVATEGEMAFDKLRISNDDKGGVCVDFIRAKEVLLTVPRDDIRFKEDGATSIEIELVRAVLPVTVVKDEHDTH